ncbi:MAG: ABC transporter permease [Lachnospiraceae bacterium]
MAILLIVALGSGFFAGLKITTDAMANTCEVFLSEQNFYDFRLFSTLGFTGEDVERFAGLSYIKAAEGTNSVDAMLSRDGSSRPYQLLAIPEQTNLPSLAAGRMPGTENECLADSKFFHEEDIGTTFRISDENDESITSRIKGEEFTVVGLVNSPLYLGLDRGTTGIGSGALYTYLYLPKEAFTDEIYTEINVVLNETAEIYSEAYDELIERYEKEITDLCNELADERYAGLLADNGLTPELGERFGIKKPETYVLTRDENAGYISFENDTSILSGVANIFPVFFILIAMLVCSTTMTRMVDEERTQIGVLKALGYSNAAVMAKYLLYAGSATLLGWSVGFFLCTWGLPQVFWYAYSVLYHFSPLIYLFSPGLAFLTLAVSLISILGTTLISCQKEFGSVPAALIRPRAAKNGRRILLERITSLWNRLTFLQKITLRNMFRYKQRLIMMLVGISCCAGLVVTAFGVRDSMIGIGALQFEDIQKYDIEATFEEGTEENVCAKLKELREIAAYHTASVHRVELLGEKAMNSVRLMSFEDTSRLSEFWEFHRGEEAVAYPGKERLS